MGIAIALSHQQVQALSETARYLPLSEINLVAAAVSDLMSRQSADFQSAADRILNTNHQLYRRVA